MKVTQAQYRNMLIGEGHQLTDIKATIDGEEMFVPIDGEGNRHWEAIQAWVAEGNTIAEAD